MKCAPLFGVFLGLLPLSLAAGGCITQVTPEEFIAKYTTNIAVPNSDSSQLPARIYLGREEDRFLIKDVIPYPQGGGFLGTTKIWSCPASNLPADFPAGLTPGDTMIDGRPRAPHRYMIEWYRQGSGPQPPGEGASGPTP